MTKTGLAGECDPQGKSEGGWTWVEEARSRRIYAAGEHPSWVQVGHQHGTNPSIPSRSCRTRDAEIWMGPIKTQRSPSYTWEVEKRIPACRCCQQQEMKKRKENYPWSSQGLCLILSQRPLLDGFPLEGVDCNRTKTEITFPPSSNSW